MVRTRREMPTGRYNKKMVDLRVQVLKHNLYTRSINQYPQEYKRFLEQQERRRRQSRRPLNVIDRARLHLNRINAAEGGENVAINEAIDVAGANEQEPESFLNFRALISLVVRKVEQIFRRN
jgi:hypothetical protein